MQNAEFAAGVALSALVIVAAGRAAWRVVFPRRNRYRPGVLGNLMLRSGALRRAR